MPLHHFIFLLGIFFLSACSPKVPSWPPVSSFMSKPTLVLVGPVLKSEKEVGSLESRFLSKAIREVTQKQDKLFSREFLKSLESLQWEKWPVGSERHIQEWESIMELEKEDFGGMATILESSPNRLKRHELALELTQSKAPNGNEELRLQGYRYGSGSKGKGFVRWFSTNQQ